MALPDKITIVEVGPRDGFQNEPNFIPTEHKIQIIDQLSETGLKRIEATSFVHPKAIPQLADASEIMARIKRKPGVCYEVLIPNLKGMERALKSGVQDVVLVVSASESHNQNNMRMSVAESLSDFKQVVRMARENGVRVTGSVATAFGCAFEGFVKHQKVASIVAEYLSMGVHEITIADTTGMADPLAVKDLAQKTMVQLKGIPLRLHLHNTRGQGLANVFAAIQEGVTLFDASICGLGGCPFSPGATGNISTADLVNMLHCMGLQTDIDLARLIECEKNTQIVIGHEVPSQVLRAGPTPWALDVMKIESNEKEEVKNEDASLCHHERWNQ
jgi:hydroxymethylglutaryl-CoA lyase